MPRRDQNFSMKGLDIMTNKSSSDFEFDLAKSLKVKSECLGGLPIYDFLLVVKYNIRKPTML